VAPAVKCTKGGRETFAAFAKGARAPVKSSANTLIIELDSFAKRLPIHPSSRTFFQFNAYDMKLLDHTGQRHDIQ